MRWHYKTATMWMNGGVTECDNIMYNALCMAQYIFIFIIEN